MPTPEREDSETFAEIARALRDEEATEGERILFGLLLVANAAADVGAAIREHTAAIMQGEDDTGEPLDQTLS